MNMNNTVKESLGFKQTFYFKTSKGFPENLLLFLYFADQTNDADKTSTITDDNIIFFQIFKL